MWHVNAITRNMKPPCHVSYSLAWAFKKEEVSPITSFFENKNIPLNGIQNLTIDNIKSLDGCIGFP